MSLAEVAGVSLRDVFEAGYKDRDYLLYVQEVTSMLVDVRAEQRREASKGR